MLLKCLARIAATHELSRVFGKKDDSYVYCLRCGQRWGYDLERMRLVERKGRDAEGTAEVRTNA